MSDTSSSARESVRQSIRENAVLSWEYVTMNALSAVVAAYGLFSDSAAVVIGAMVIATLLGPILGIALALVDGGVAMLRRALVAEIAGVAVVAPIAYCIGAIHHDLPLTGEILSRTDPGVIDLMIALAGGAAGAYAAVSPRLNAGLVGVAIATALVPPLAVCGICLARDEYRLAFGSFLLFCTNFAAIQFASSAVMWLRGYRAVTQRVRERKTIMLGDGLSLGLIVGLVAVLTFHVPRVIAKQLVESMVRSRLREDLLQYPDAKLLEVRFVPSADALIATVMVRTPYPFTAGQVADMEATLPARGRTKVELRVRSVITHDAAGRAADKNKNNASRDN
jgi:uncharacterized hydrophobic protein (TIGR00271 family)